MSASETISNIANTSRTSSGLPLSSTSSGSTSELSNTSTTSHSLISSVPESTSTSIPPPSSSSSSPSTSVPSPSNSASTTQPPSTSRTSESEEQTTTSTTTAPPPPPSHSNQPSSVVTTVIQTTVVTLSNGNAVSTVYETKATVNSGAAVTGAPSSGISSSSDRTGAIVGGVVGGIFGLAALLVALFFYRRWKRNQTFSDFDGDFAPDRVERSMSQVKHFGGRNHKSYDRDLPTLPSIPVEDTTVPHYTDIDPPHSPTGQYYPPPSSVSEGHTHSSHMSHHYPYQNDFSHPSPGPSLAPLTASNTGGAPSFVSSLDMIYSHPPSNHPHLHLHQPQPQYSRDIPSPTNASYPISPPRSPPLHAYTGGSPGRAQVLSSSRLSDRSPTGSSENVSVEGGDRAAGKRLSVANPDLVEDEPEEGYHEEGDNPNVDTEQVRRGEKSCEGSEGSESGGGVVYAGGYGEDARKAYLAGGPGVSRRSDS